VSEFAYNVEANAQATFYNNLALITESFIRKELEKMSLNSISVRNRRRGKQIVVEGTNEMI